MPDEPDKLRSVLVGRVTGKFVQPAEEIRGHLTPIEPRVGTMHTQVTFGEASIDLPLLSEQQQAELRAFLRVVYEAGRLAKEDGR